MFDGTRFKVGGKNQFFGLISPSMESPDFWHFISQLGTVLYRKHIVPGRQESAALKILKIIESPLDYIPERQSPWDGLTGSGSWMKIPDKLII